MRAWPFCDAYREEPIFLQVLATNFASTHGLFQ